MFLRSIDYIPSDESVVLRGAEDKECDKEVQMEVVEDWGWDLNLCAFGWTLMPLSPSISVGRANGFYVELVFKTNTKYIWSVDTTQFLELKWLFLLYYKIVQNA